MQASTWYKTKLQMAPQLDPSVTNKWHLFGTNMWQGCDTSVTGVWHECDRGVTWVWHGCPGDNGGVQWDGFMQNRLQAVSQLFSNTYYMCPCYSFKYVRTYGIYHLDHTLCVLGEDWYFMKAPGMFMAACTWAFYNLFMLLGVSERWVRAEWEPSESQVRAKWEPNEWPRQGQWS